MEIVRLSLNQTKIRNEGKDALSLSDALRVSALRISRELEPFGKTLDDAGAHYLKFLRDSHNSITVERLVAEFMGDQVRRKHSVEHISDLKGRVGRFAEKFGQASVRTITTPEIQQWLDGIKLEPQSINNFRDRICAMFNFAIRHKYLDAGFFSKIASIRRNSLSLKPSCHVTFPVPSASIAGCATFFNVDVRREMLVGVNKESISSFSLNRRHRKPL